MTAAKVEFLTLAGEPCPAGEKPARFTFLCVGWNRGAVHPGLRRVKCANLLIAEGAHSARHGIKHDPQGSNGGRPQWDWDGNADSPTFSPSINCEGHCGWHGYIRGGRCIDTHGNDEPDT